jgi:hypothetical protein
MLVTIEAPDDENEPFEVREEYLAALLETIYPWRFTDSMLGPSTDWHDAYDWCRSMFGPNAVDFGLDEDGEAIPGTPKLIRARPWAAWFGIIYFKDQTHAAAFKIVWWPGKQRPRRG